MFAGRRADEVLEAVPLLVVAVGDRLGVFPVEVGDESGQVGPGMLALLPPHEAGRERLGELGEPLDAPIEDLRADGAFGE